MLYSWSYGLVISFQLLNLDILNLDGTINFNYY